MQMKWDTVWSLILKKIPAEARKNSHNKESVKQEIKALQFLEQQRQGNGSAYYKNNNVENCKRSHTIDEV